MIAIKTTGNTWRMYWGAMPLPADAEALGTVTRDTDGSTGALLRLASGQYAQGNAGSIRTLPQREVAEALALAAAAASIGAKGGKSTSPAKRAAAAVNGRKGGRPKRTE